MRTVDAALGLTACLFAGLPGCTPEVQCKCRCDAPDVVCASTSDAVETAAPTTRTLGAEVEWCAELRLPPDAYRVQGAKEGPMVISRKLDLDVDGFADAWVTAPQFCNDADRCVYRLYAQSESQVPKRCGRYLGLARGEDFRTELLRHEGILGFQALERLGRARDGMAIVRYRFDGREYVGSEQQLCIPNEGGNKRCLPVAPLGGVPLPPEGWDQPSP